MKNIGAVLARRLNRGALRVHSWQLRAILIIAALPPIFLLVRRLQVSDPVSYLDADRISSSLREQSGQACIHPVLAAHHPDTDRFYGQPDQLPCLSRAETDWVYTDRALFRVSENATRRHGKISCRYVPLLRGDDDLSVKNGEQIEQFDDGRPLVSDFFEVNCVAADGSTYKNIHAGISTANQSVSENIPLTERSRINRLLDDIPTGSSLSAVADDGRSGLDLDVIIFGFDTVSRSFWRRLLPRSYAFFVDRLGGTVLDGYNVVGDGTTEALLAMLTGRRETELPEARRGHPGASTVDGFPWIWRRLAEVGYVSQFGEDQAGWAAFNYRLLGFDRQPVDHYMRPFQILVEKDESRDKHCLRGSTPEHLAMMNWQREFVRVYRRRRKFSFMFFAGLSHNDPRQLRLADDDLLRLLKDFDDEGHLDAAVLILMSDHGPRFGDFRSSEQGRLEERSPFLGMRVPPRLTAVHTRVAANLAANAHRLTTPYDVHATLLEMVKFTGDGVGDRKQRGISLFKEVPKERTCQDAGVLDHWCGCLSWSSVDVGERIVQRASEAVVHIINNLTRPHRSVCAQLNVSHIKSAVRYSPGEALLRFRQSKDSDGREPDLSDTWRSAAEVLYQLTLVTAPNDGIYQVTVRHLIPADRLAVGLREISRLDRYGEQPRCVAERFPHLRQFCYCVDASRTVWGSDPPYVPKINKLKGLS